MIKATVRKFVPPTRQPRPVMQIITEGMICILGLLSSVLIHIVGDLFVTELILITCLPFFLFARGRSLLKPYTIRLLVLLGLWFLSQVLTDAYREVVMTNRLRGMANIAFFAAEIACLTMLLTSDRRKTIFLAFYAIGSIVMARLSPYVASFDERGDRWKWGYATGCILLTVLISCFLIARRQHIFALLLLFGTNAVNLLYNYRSAFLELLVTTVLVVPFIPERIGSLRLLPRRNNLLRVAIVATFALAGGWSANQLVKFASQSGLVSEEAQLKNESEASVGNLILGGRPEFFIGLQAAIDSPLLGHGSWASDLKYAELMAEWHHESGQQGFVEQERESQGVIPTHSHIIAAWVFAGILGILFWAYLFWLVLRAIVVVAIRRPTLAPIYAWLLVSYCWAILFSPFGSTSRIIEAVTIVIIVDLLEPKTVGVRGTHLLKGRWKRFGLVRRAPIAMIPNLGRSRPWRVH
ncbi:hypothetical protein P8935_14285 [Telmatobacter sp. DSM 110680]|uniref:O-antigen ligase n=1 Tax=Telmatobacter sp. DSM 110680 TaxID=3036704 RepID=A0AAU7DD42_9BACT